MNVAKVKKNNITITPKRQFETNAKPTVMRFIAHTELQNADLVKVIIIVHLLTPCRYFRDETHTHTRTHTQIIKSMLEKYKTSETQMQGLSK